MKNSISADNNMYVFLPPVAFFMFALASSLSLKDRPIYAKLKTIGVLVYFLHQFVNQGIWAFKKALLHFLGIDIQPFQFFITLALTIFIAGSFVCLSNKKRYKWIRWFFS